MKKLRLILATLLCMILTVSVFGACGNNEDNVDKDGNRIIKLLVHVAEQSAEGRAYDARVKAFNEAYKEQKIKASVTYKARVAGAGGYETELTNMISDGSIPDIITFDSPNVWSYADAGILYPIETLVSDEAKSDILEISKNTYNNTLYGLPIQESSAGIFYNKNLFRQAGVYDRVKDMTVTDPWTFDEFKSVCEALKTSGKLPANGFAVDMRLDANNDETAPYLLSSFISAQGGEMLSSDGLTATGYLNSDKSLSGFTFLRSMIDNGYTKASMDKDGFFTGKYAMYISSGWTIPEIEGEHTTTFPNREAWGLLPYPKGSVKACAPTGSWSFGMANIDRGSKEEVALLLEWLVSTDSSLAITNATGMIPARKSAVERKNYINGSPEKMLYDQLVASGTKRPNTIAYPEFSTAFQTIIKNICNGDKVSTYLNTTTANLQGNLDRYKK